MRPAPGNDPADVNAAICRAEEECLSNRDRMRLHEGQLTDRLQGLRCELTDADTAVITAENALCRGAQPAQSPLHGLA